MVVELDNDVVGSFSNDNLGPTISLTKLSGCVNSPIPSPSNGLIELTPPPRTNPIRIFTSLFTFRFRFSKTHLPGAGVMRGAKVVEVDVDVEVSSGATVVVVYQL